jgi:protein-tyrosine phosphatase
MFKRILVLCTGNICRSPMAEALLRQRMAALGRELEVRSAGVGALRNYPADEPARELMQARGLDISPHRAQQVTPELARWADLILVMESQQRDAMVDIDPTARGKTYLLGHWIGQEVPDPYQQPEQVYTRALSLIDESLESWVKKL